MKKIMFLLVAAGALMVPLMPVSPFLLRMIIQIYLYGLLAMSLNLITGYTGQLSLGHAAFYGIGAYTSALLSLHYGWPFPVTVTAAGIMAAVASLIIGIPALRLTGAYLAIVTLGFNEIIRMTALNWMELTRGPMGLPGIPAPDLILITVSSAAGFYYLILGMLILIGLLLYQLIHSSVGRALIAIREDPLAAEAMGIPLLRYKALSFTLSAMIAGMAGSFYAHYASFIDPQGFSFQESIQILSMVVLGGMGSFLGPLAGAALLVSVPELLRGAQDYRMILHGFVLVMIMLLRPQGLLGGIDGERMNRHANRIKALLTQVHSRHESGEFAAGSGERDPKPSEEEVPHVIIVD